MALTYTPEHSVGLQLPTFSLKTVEGKNWHSQDIIQAKAKVIVFICNHCPYVKAIESRLIQTAAELKNMAVPFIAICSNDPSEYPEDSPAALLKNWQDKKMQFTYLIDDSQVVAKAFGAVCTPDFFVFDHNNTLKYRGRLDDSWKNKDLVKNEELKMAVQDILKTGEVSFTEVPSMGCSIKWKSL